MKREEAIWHLKRCKKRIPLMNTLGELCKSKTIESIDMAIEALQDRPTGKWIKAKGVMPPEFHGHHFCSECGNFANMEPPFGNREDLSEFCPNCGVYMRGEEE